MSSLVLPPPTLATGLQLATKARGSCRIGAAQADALWPRPFDLLGRDAILLIFQHVPYASKAVLPLVCKRWRALAADPFATNSAWSVNVSLVGTFPGCGKSLLAGLLADAVGVRNRLAGGKPLPPLPVGRSPRALADHLAQHASHGARAPKGASSAAGAAALTVAPGTNFASWYDAPFSLQMSSRSVVLTACPSAANQSRRTARALVRSQLLVGVIDANHMLPSASGPAGAPAAEARRRLEELMTTAYALRVRLLVALTHTDELATGGAADAVVAAQDAVLRLARRWTLPLARSDVVPVCALTGCNVLHPQWDAATPSLLDAMSAAVSLVPLAVSDVARPLRIMVERIHKVPRVGLVAVGRVLSGVLSRGDALEFVGAGTRSLPSASASRHTAVVRSIQAALSQQPMAEALPGDLVGMALDGVTADKLARGTLLAAAGTHPAAAPAASSPAAAAAGLTRRELLSIASSSLSSSSSSSSSRAADTVRVRLVVSDARGMTVRVGSWSGLLVARCAPETPVRVARVLECRRTNHPRRTNVLHTGDVVDAELTLNGHAVAALGLRRDQMFLVRENNQTVLLGRVLPDE